jgi:transaldolase
LVDQFNSKLHEMSLTTPTNYWNDSCSVEDLNYAILNGAVGATSNPIIVLNVLKKEINLWSDYIHQVIGNNPSWSEIEVSWDVYKSLALNGAKLLLPVHERENRKFGRLSIQTDPALYRNSVAILKQAEYFHSLAPNMQVKIPATSAGIGMIEEATYRGVNLNITISFTVPQAVAAAAAIERGLKRREVEGKDISTMSPLVTIMVGRTDDWMKVLAKLSNLEIPSEYLEWPGVACFKKAYNIYMRRGYRARLLAAAYRNFYHWTEFIGGEVSLTIPYKWQEKFNQSSVHVKPAINEAVKDEILETLYEKIPDFRKAYDEDGMTIQEFDTYGATVRTLRSFIAGWHDFVALIRDYMLPNPDLEP